jgi:hypothetical protein
MACSITAPGERRDLLGPSPERRTEAVGCDWGEAGPQPGLVVMEHGTITGVSAWRLLAAAAPFAIAPPLVVLALGASLAWALAGFKRGCS